MPRKNPKPSKSAQREVTGGISEDYVGSISSTCQRKNNKFGQPLDMGTILGNIASRMKTAFTLAKNI